MVFRSGRSVSRLTQLNKQCVRSATSSIHFERVPSTYTALSVLRHTLSKLNTFPCTSFQARFYATKPAKPKAHQGTTAKARKPRATKAADKTTKPKAKTSTKKAAKPKKKAKAKPKVKKTKKPARKAKPLSPEEAAKAQVRSLKALALSPPKPGPTTAWTVLNASVGKEMKGTASAFGGSTLAAKERYHAFSPEERERYNQQANQNKEKAQAEYRAWLNTFTPMQIRRANLARTQLNGLHKGGSPYVKKSMNKLRDERIVKRPVTAYMLFNVDRTTSGDFAGMNVRERAPLVSKEYRALSAAEKKPYLDRAAADHERYVEECKTVYGADYGRKRAARKTTTT